MDLNQFRNNNPVSQLQTNDMSSLTTLLPRHISRVYRHAPVDVHAVAIIYDIDYSQSKKDQPHIDEVFPVVNSYVSYFALDKNPQTLPFYLRSSQFKQGKDPYLLDEAVIRIPDISLFSITEHTNYRWNYAWDVYKTHLNQQ